MAKYHVRVLQSDRAVRIGALLWTDRTAWSDLRDAAVAADRAGFDSVWLSDHLLAPLGSWRDSTLEAWTALAAVAASTERVSVGTLVSPVSLRNPGLIAKLAVTVDHISGGRAVLGLGAGWLEREHEAHGYGFDSRAGDRLDRLREAVTLIRQLLDAQTITHAGRHYTFTEAAHNPPPLQPHLPILIGGEGRHKTLRLVAEHADLWHARGGLDDLRALDAQLVEHCTAVGRQPSAITRLTSAWVSVRSDARDAREALETSMRFHGVASAAPITLTGDETTVAAGLQPYVEAGFRHIIFSLRAPWDHETIERLPRVRACLAAGVATSS